MTTAQMAKCLVRQGYIVADDDIDAVRYDPRKKEKEIAEFRAKNIAGMGSGYCRTPGWVVSDMQYHGGMFYEGEW